MSNITPKKTWNKPEIYILDSPQGGGNVPQVNERTAFKNGSPTTVRGTAPGQIIETPNNVYATFFENAHS